jgi:hypothetical protein
MVTSSGYGGGDFLRAGSGVGKATVNALGNASSLSNAPPGIDESVRKSIVLRDSSSANGNGKGIVDASTLARDVGNHSTFAAGRADVGLGGGASTETGAEAGLSQLEKRINDQRNDREFHPEFSPLGGARLRATRRKLGRPAQSEHDIYPAEVKFYRPTEGHQLGFQVSSVAGVGYRVDSVNANSPFYKVLPPLSQFPRVSLFALNSNSL